MGSILVAVALAAMTMHTEAASCHETAQEKKLSGAALDRFMKKCQADAKSACEATAKAQKLAGGAKDSFTKKCVGDVVGGN